MHYCEIQLYTIKNWCAFKYETDWICRSGYGNHMHLTVLSLTDICVQTSGMYDKKNAGRGSMVHISKKIYLKKYLIKLHSNHTWQNFGPYIF